MRAISIRQPWCWAILHAGKRVENRDWKGCSYRGPVLLHAGKSVGTIDDFDEAAQSVLEVASPGAATRFRLEVEMYTRGREPKAWRPGSLSLGGIVGRANIVGVVLPGGYSTGRVYPSARAAHMRHELADSPWYTGGFALVLADVEPLPFVSWKGELGLFEVPDDYAARAAEGARS